MNNNKHNTKNETPLFEKIDTKEEHTGVLDGLGEALARYFKAHADGNIPTGLYNCVIQEAERHLLYQTLVFTGNNQMRTAYILGISRNTLRKKLLKLKQETPP
ncbi:MAG: hypothetical protein LBH38_04320 [Holosporales bacterium]|jgi:Fis family transcriptional regulator|nr:hypothetical protein [Holosporales bacterium]